MLSVQTARNTDAVSSVLRIAHVSNNLGPFLLRKVYALWEARQ